MKKMLLALSVLLALVFATGVSADIRSDKCNSCSDDIVISSALDKCTAANIGIPKKNKKRKGDSSNGVRKDGC